MAGVSPTRTTAAPYSRAAATAPSTTTPGPWSPPMASTAIFMPPGPRPSGPFRRDDLPAFVVAAMWAHAVRQLRLPALRAHGARRGGQLVMRPAFATSGLGVAAFRQRH